MTRAEKIASKKLDAEIERIYRENCNNIQIPIMEIPKLYAEARKAHTEGRDMKDTIVAYVEKIRRN